VLNSLELFLQLPLTLSSFIVIEDEKNRDGLGSSGETVGKTGMMLHTDHPHMKVTEIQIQMIENCMSETVK
jgi:hypothetical protein